MMDEPSPFEQVLVDGFEDVRPCPREPAEELVAALEVVAGAEPVALVVAEREFRRRSASDRTGRPALRRRSGIRSTVRSCAGR